VHPGPGKFSIKPSLYYSPLQICTNVCAAVASRLPVITSAMDQAVLQNVITAGSFGC